MTVPNPISTDRPAAVYRYYDAGGVLLYLGSAYDPDERWQREHRRKPWAADVVRRADLWYANRDVAYAVETAAIKDELPKHNVTNNPAAVAPTRSGSPVIGMFVEAIRVIEGMDDDGEAAVAASRLLDDWADFPAQLRAVRQARASKMKTAGKTWAEIGAAFEVTPQRAQQIATGVNGAQRRRASA